MRIKFFLFLLFLRVYSLPAQGIFEKIEAGLNSSVNVKSLDNKGIHINSAVAFFISNDGLAITNSSILQDADSVIFYDNNGKHIEINNIVALHNFGNLALIHLKIQRPNNYGYFTPSKTAYAGESELLAFVNSRDIKDRLSYGKIENVQRCIIGGRIATVNIKSGNSSDCSPVIDNNGNFIGIFRISDSDEKGFLFPVSYINDTSWVSVNQKWHEFKLNPEKERLTSPFFYKTILCIAEKNWVDASQNLTEFIKYFPENSNLYALRAYCRVKYGNHTSGNRDIMISEELNPNNPFSSYSKAIYFLERNDKRRALNELFTAIDKDPNFAEAFLEIGKIQTFNNDIKRAFASFTYAVQIDSLLAEAWYERGRLSLLHSSNLNNALSDLYTAARLDPSLTGVYSLTGEIRLKNKDFPEAISDFDKAIKRNPNDTHALTSRGIALYNNGFTDKACEDWSNAAQQGSIQAIKMINSYCTPK